MGGCAGLAGGGQRGVRSALGAGAAGAGPARRPAAAVDPAGRRRDADRAALVTHRHRGLRRLRRDPAIPAGQRRPTAPPRRRAPEPDARPRPRPRPRPARASAALARGGGQQLRPGTRGHPAAPRRSAGHQPLRRAGPAPGAANLRLPGLRPRASRRPARRPAGAAAAAQPAHGLDATGTAGGTVRAGPGADAGRPGRPALRAGRLGAARRVHAVRDGRRGPARQHRGRVRAGRQLPGGRGGRRAGGVRAGRRVPGGGAGADRAQPHRARRAGDRTGRPGRLHAQAAGGSGRPAATVHAGDPDGLGVGAPAARRRAAAGAGGCRLLPVQVPGRRGSAAAQLLPRILQWLRAGRQLRGGGAARAGGAGRAGRVPAVLAPVPGPAGHRRRPDRRPDSCGC